MEHFRDAISTNKIEIVKLFLANVKEISENMRDKSLRIAPYDPRMEIVKILLADPRFDPSADDNYVLIEAIKNSEIENVKLFLANERIRPNESGYRPLIYAVVVGQIEIAKLLIKKIDYKEFTTTNSSSERDNFLKLLIACETDDPDEINKIYMNSCLQIGWNQHYYFRRAVQRGNEKTVRMFLALDKVDIFAKNNWALKNASRKMKVILRDHVMAGLPSTDVAKFLDDYIEIMK